MLRRFGAVAWARPLPSFAAAASFGAAALLIVLLPRDRIDALTVVLAIAAVIAGLVVHTGEVAVSASFIVTLIAAAFLGPASAAAMAVLAEIAAAVRDRSSVPTVVLNNLPGAVLASVAAAAVVRALAPVPVNRVGFYLAVLLAGLVSIVLSFGMWSTLHRMLLPERPRFGLETLLEFLPSAGISVLLTVAGTAITLEVGNAGISFALAGVFAFSYMAHLLHQSRQRAQQYVSLSWGVLAGLMRALDVRDQRAARHAAAVAHFSRDMAQAVGMGEAQCELAHTAGLLHDIGRFALSDRVAERGRVLTDEDWVAIHRHPELGADMLRDLGMYGPVAEIVLAHHERIDGRGYPRRLPASEIPEIAKIIAVAEVYDTLTAADTYRTRMSSFEALTELRRVADTQVDARYVEVLAQLLTGEGVDYRHADLADFDSELDMERRITQAGAGA